MSLIQVFLKVISKLSKRILIITQFFDPEPTFKGLLFAKELVSRGFEVEVITGFPNYPGGTIYPGYKIKIIQRAVIEGVLVTRVPLFPSHDKSKLGRIACYISFAFSSLIYGLFFAKRPNVIYAYHPPLTVGISAIVIKFFRRVPVVLDIQDMWPDTLKATGMLNNVRLLEFTSKVCKVVYKAVTQIVVLSPGFKKLLIDRGVPARKIEVIYNWADELKIKETGGFTPKEFANIGGFKILFAGNIGQAQGLNVIADAALLLKDECPTLNFVVLGKGLKLSELKLRVKSMSLNNVHFISHVSMDEVGSFLNCADVLLVHLNSDPLFEVTIPGKTQAYMAAGKPLIMGVRGDAANLISMADCGVCIEPQDAFSLAEAVKHLSSLSSADIQALGENAVNFYDHKLSVKVGVDAFSEIFQRF